MLLPSCRDVSCRCDICTGLPGSRPLYDHRIIVDIASVESPPLSVCLSFGLLGCNSTPIHRFFCILIPDQGSTESMNGLERPRITSIPGMCALLPQVWTEYSDTVTREDEIRTSGFGVHGYCVDVLDNRFVRNIYGF